MTSLLQASLSIQDRLRRYILLLAGAEDGGVRNGAVLQKLLYILAKKTGDGGTEASFRPGEYGPHSEQAAGELARLSRDGLVSLGPEGRIAPTPAGRSAARDAGRGLDEYAQAVIEGHVPFLNAMADEELALYMHLVYPDMSAGSSACAALAKRSEEIVMGMVRDGKVSSGRAAEVMGIPFHDVIPMMKRHGIPNLQ